MKKPIRTVIGRTDKIDLPEFELENLGCKIDTGAAISSLHCHSVKLVEKDGVEHLYFKLLDKKHPKYQGVYYHTTDFKERVIRNSFGQEQTRFSLTTEIELFGQKFKTEFTLADREKMLYPILIGRSLLREGFIVDVTKTNLSAKRKKAKNTP